MCEIFKDLSFFDFRRDEIRESIDAYGRFRNDHATLNLSSRRWSVALGLVSTLKEPDLLYLKELSSVNLTHLEAHTTRKAALYFGFYPAVLSFLLTRLPEFIPLLKPALGAFLPVYVFVVCAGGFMFFNFYTAKWQAMEIDTCLQVALARHRLQATRISDTQATERDATSDRPSRRPNIALQPSAGTPPPK